MKNKLLLLTLLLTTLVISSLSSQNIGINTENPQAALDINGDVIYRVGEMLIDDTVMTALDVNTERFSSYRITEADSAFVLAGITSAMDGRVITLVNQSGEPMTLHHMDTLADEENQIVTGNHEDLILDDMGTVSMQYDTALMKWIVNNSNQIPAGADVWDTTSTGIFFEEFVGIGTDSPSAPLTIMTELDEIGFSHTAGEDSITIASSVSELFGAVGTTTNHMFTLKTNNQGQMHLLPQGNLILGSTAQASQFTGPSSTRMPDFDSKITVFTPVGESALLHIAGDDEIQVAQGADSWLGAYHYGYIGTLSDHPFRLNAGNNVAMNLFPTGQSVFGSILDSPFGDAKLTAYTGNNTDGFTQIGGEGQRIALRIGGSSCAVGTYSDHGLRIVSNSVGRLQIFPDGRITVSPNDYAALGQFTVYGGVPNDPNNNGLTVVTPNNTNGIVQVGGDGQRLAMRIGGSSAAIGTYTPHIMRIVSNGVARINIDPNGNIAIGLPDPLPGYMLSVNGNVKARELVIETTGWPDYVFDQKYKLTPLRELENFIQIHHHLPNIPPASEIENNGISVGDMQKNMMEKIEELTLYIIELHERIEKLESQKNK